jgi:menaquinone-dependent protoporphyrinogen IX oxidase
LAGCKIKKELIAYGSPYGSTEEITCATAQILEKEGLETQLLDLKHTKQKAWPPSASFDGILVGSGLKMFRWVGGATILSTSTRTSLKRSKRRARVNDL